MEISQKKLQFQFDGKKECCNNLKFIEIIGLKNNIFIKYIQIKFTLYSTAFSPSSSSFDKKGP